MIFLLAVLAMGAPDTGRYVLHPTPGARVIRFPRTEPLRIELGVYDNTARLDEQLEGKTAAWVQDVDAVSVGGGIWFVTFYVQQPDIGLTWETEATRLVISLKPGLARDIDPTPVVTVEELVAGTVPRRPAPVAENALRPLYGDASTLVLNADDYVPSVPRWNPGRVPPPWRDLAVAPAFPNHTTIDRYRSALTSSRDPKVREVSLYRLGTALQELSMHRDALYYLNQLEGSRSLVPESSLHLEKARAQMHLRRWDHARASCRAAWGAGAGALLTLRCLGTVSLKTSDPAPTETARALAEVDPEPLSQLIAAQLLIRDRRYSEAATLLAPLARRVEGPIASTASANLGDTLLAEGDLDGAARAWNRARASGSHLVPLLNTRIILHQMIKEGPASWPAHIPELEARTGVEGAPGAEPHYLLAQIATTYGDHELAATHLAGLIDRHRELAVASDVPERLFAIAQWRIGDLLRQGRIAEGVAFYRDYWRSPLDKLIDDTGTLEKVAAGLAELGLYESALNLSREVSVVDLRFGRENPEALWRLAGLYARTGRSDEAQSTVEYIRRLRSKAPPSGRQSLLEGEVFHLLGDDELAATAWTRASRDPEAGREAVARLSLLRARSNRCQLALEGLETSLSGEPPLGAVLRDEVALARARCLMELDRGPEAIAAAVEIAATSQDSGVIESARYLGAVVATESGSSELPAPLSPPNPTWEALLREEREAVEFQERIAPRLKGAGK